MARPLKSLFNSCIGLSCERDSGVERNMKKTAKSDGELQLEENVDLSNTDFPLNANGVQSDVVPDNQPLSWSTVVHDVENNGSDNVAHNALYSTASTSAIEGGINHRARNISFPTSHNSDGSFRQKSDAQSLYESTHMAFVPGDIHPCVSGAVPCDSSSNSNNWCAPCRAKFQLQVDSVSGLLRASLSQKTVGNKKSLWSFFKSKHKDKNAKDSDRNQFVMLNSTERSYKFQDLEQAHSQVDTRCTCCCFPRHDDFEYKPKDCQATASNCSFHQSCAEVSHQCAELSLMDSVGENQIVRAVVDPHVIPPVLEELPRIYPDVPCYFKRTLQMDRIPRSWRLPQQHVHTQINFIHCLVPDLLAITNCGFYWGKMDRFEAERLIENKPEGTFLLRDSAQEDYLFSVSFCRHERSLHARIEQSNHKFSFDPLDPGVFSSDTVCGLLEFYKDPTCCMFYDPVLTNPLPRTFPFPLQHLCRSTICSRISYNGISQLQLPRTLKNYLKEYHYKQKVSVTHYD